MGCNSTHSIAKEPIISSIKSDLLFSEELTIKRADFIKENTGEFKNCYKVGTQLGVGILNNLRRICRSKKM